MKRKAAPSSGCLTFALIGTSVFCAAILTPDDVAAQDWRWGGQVGAVRSWFAGDRDFWSSRDGLHFAGLLARDLTERVGLRAELAYTRRGTRIADTPDLEGRGGGRDSQFDYMELAALGVLKEESPWSGLSVYLAGGPVLSHRLSCTVRDPDQFRFVGRPDTEEMDCDSAEWEREGLVLFRRTQLLVSGSVGVSHDLGSESGPGFFLEFRLAEGLTDLESAGLGLHHRSGSVVVGVLWPW